MSSPVGNAAVAASPADLGRMLDVDPVAVEAPAPSAEAGLCDDENDCVSLIQSWMGNRGTSDNMRAIRFDEVDRELKLVPGSARKYIAKAAERWSYTVAREGKDTILFERPSRVIRRH